MLTPMLAKAFTSGAAVNPNRIVKIGAADGAVIQATASSDICIGVSAGAVQATQTGERVDVILGGIAEIKAGGSITRGTLVTSDASGQAVAPGAVAGTNYYVIGYALNAASSGDLVAVLIVPSRAQG